MVEPRAGSRRRVTGIVLAAGRSTRFGSGLPKQLHKVHGETLVCRIARIALGSKLRQIVVVAGHRAAEVGAAVAGLAVEVVINSDFAEGQATSVRMGLSRIEPEAEAAMFIPCDLSNLTAETIDKLIAVYGESDGPIVVPVFEGKRYAPVLFDCSLFDEIDGITGDQGARQLFPAHQAEIVEVEFESRRPFEDLDRVS
jgi:molybdenum cofactor cytidylyltransferase